MNVEIFVAGFSAENAKTMSSFEERWRNSSIRRIIPT